MPEDKQRVKHFTLARVISEFLKRMPNAVRGGLVKRDGRMMVRVEEKEGGQRDA